MTTMKEFFRSLKEDFEKALAFWMLNNMDLIQAFGKVIYTFLAYLKMGLYCMTLPYQFVKLFIQNLRSSEN
jgi:hypothetical protein